MVRTHSQGVLHSYQTAQTNAHNSFNAASALVVTSLTQRKNYMPAADFASYTSQISGLGSSLPSYITDSWTYTWYTWNHRWWGGWPSWHRGYNLNLNYNFYNMMTEWTENLNNIQTSINNLTESDCNNPNTMTSSSEYECGLLNATLDYQSKIQPTKNISNGVVSSLQPTDPQYKTANTLNGTINNLYNWDYKSGHNEYNPEYSQLSKSSVEQTYTLTEQYVSTLYNVCSSPNTAISLSPATGKPYCITDKYDLASKTCNTAISMSGPKMYNYPTGYEQLNKLWTNVSDAIPGNTATAGNSILDSAQTSCNKWVEMFNVWQTMEEKAAATPCTPERTIQTTYDPVMLQMAENWSASATSYIESLMQRLAIIEKYIETYPNILQLDTQDVTFGPSSLGASMLLKYKVNQLTPGVAPVQYLEMLIPNGQDGDQGVSGTYGLDGKTGNPGPQGQVGSTGNPELPNVFQNKCK